jgi:hypothetical protein
MAMSASELADQLLGLAPVPTEAQAVVTLADAYGEFAAGASAGAATITPAGVALGKAAMQVALAGISSPGAGAAVLTAAIQAFWVAVASGLATSFAAATAIVPPPHAGLQVALEATFAANTASGASLADATQAVATVIHNQAIIGGAVTFPGPSVSPIV